MLVWICGPSAAGKTTIGRHLYARLKPTTPNLVFIDGDEFRHAVGDDLGYSPEDRRRNSLRIARFCNLLVRQGIHVICCAVTIHPDAQSFNRAQTPHYLEVFIETSVETLMRRDTKGLYEKALHGKLENVAGINQAYTPPPAPDLVLNNDRERNDFSDLVQQILRRIEEKGVMPTVKSK